MNYVLKYYLKFSLEIIVNRIVAKIVLEYSHYATNLTLNNLFDFLKVYILSVKKIILFQI
jgi:hypothetical protein